MCHLPVLRFSHVISALSSVILLSHRSANLIYHTTCCMFVAFFNDYFLYYVSAILSVICHVISGYTIFCYLFYQEGTEREKRRTDVFLNIQKPQPKRPRGGL